MTGIEGSTGRSAAPFPAPGPAAPGPAGPAATPPARRFRPLRHVLPALVVLAVVGVFVVVAAVVFSAAFLVDDEMDLNARDAASTLGFLAALVLGVTLFCVVGGVLLDLSTVRAPWFVRVPAVLVVPALGAVLLAVGVDVGYYLLELSVPLCVYWAVLVVQDPLLRAAKWLLRQLRGTPSDMSSGRAGR